MEALVANIGVGFILSVGVVLAASGRFTAHRWVQTVAVTLSIIVAFWTMARPYVFNVDAPSVSTSPTWFVTAHALIGLAAVVLGVVVVLWASGAFGAERSAGKWKTTMRTSYALYMVSIGLGLAARLS